MQILKKPYEGLGRVGGDQPLVREAWREFCDTLRMRCERLHYIVPRIVLRKLCPELYGGSTC